ncbi:MAG: DUF599 domain-containing protein [Gallionellaceae bacterium]|jgi:uncharacterized membrane protein
MQNSESNIKVAGETAVNLLQHSNWLEIYGVDIYSFVTSALLLLAYYLLIAHKTRKNPAYTVQSVNIIARTAWVESIMRDGGKEVLAVQTLRNSTMAATFLASTSVLLIIGVLTLSAQGDKMEGTWHALNMAGNTHNELWLTKLLIMLLDLFVAFFSFSMAVRVFNHVGYMINVPLARNHKMICPQHVAIHLNRAGMFYSVGMRAYYFTVPLVFWLFGPHFMLLSTLALILILYRLDRAPKILAEDYAEDSAHLSGAAEFDKARAST